MEFTKSELIFIFNMLNGIHYGLKLNESDEKKRQEIMTRIWEEIN